MPLSVAKLKVKIDGDNRSAKKAIGETKSLSKELASSIGSSFKSGLFTLFGFEKLLQGMGTIVTRHQEVIGLVRQTGTSYTEAFRAARIAVKNGVDALDILGKKSDEVNAKVNEIRTGRARAEFAQARTGPQTFEEIGTRIVGANFGELLSRAFTGVATAVGAGAAGLNSLTSGRVGMLSSVVEGRDPMQQLMETDVQLAETLLGIQQRNEQHLEAMRAALEGNQ